MKRYIYLLLISLWAIAGSANVFACQFTVGLFDDYSDGWNGGSIDILVNGTPVLTGLTLSNGNGPALFTFSANDGDSISVVYTSGSWPAENFYYIYDATGNQIFADGLGGTSPVGGLAGIATCPDHDLAVIDWIGPRLGCNLGMESITILVFNNGTNSEVNFTVSYSIDGGNNYVTDTITSSLAPGDSLEHTFTTQANFSSTATYICSAVVNLATDEAPVNDTLDSLIIHNSPIVNTFPYNQDFESGPGSWHSGGLNSSWEHAMPAGDNITTANSGSYCWITDADNYPNNNEASWVESPCFDLSGLINPVVSLAFYCMTDSYDDGAALQYTTDGVNWYHVGSSGDPNNWFDTWNVNALGPFGNTNGWSGYWYGWYTATHNIAFLAGQPFVKFRFIFGSDSYFDEEDGFAFDDFIIFQPPFMHYEASSVTQDNTGDVGQGTPRAEILGIQIETDGSTQAISATDFFFNTPSVKSGNIDSARLYYTGDDPDFAPWREVGQATRPASPFSFHDTVNLLEGTNYFWLAFDVLLTANPGDSLDASLDSLRVDDTTRIPANGDPNGSRLILEAMAGTYIIDSAGTGDYLSFSAAVHDLLTRGIKDSVMFLIKPGHYDEQFQLPPIPGSSATNHITFKSYTGDSSSVVLHHEHTSTDSNYIIQFTGADYITFERITMKADMPPFKDSAPSGRVIEIYGNSQYLNFISNMIIGLAVTSTSSYYTLVYSGYYNDSYCRFISNTFRNGSVGLHLEGSSYDREVGTVVKKNRFENFYYRGVYLANQEGAIFSFNVLIAAYTAYSMYVAQFYQMYGINQVVSNMIIAQAANYLYGIYMTYWYSGIKSQSIVANNSISVESTGTNVGRGLYINDVENTLIAHNSVNLSSNSTSSMALYANDLTDVSIFNNIFNNNGPGYALYFSDTAGTDTCDHNVLRTTGSSLGYMDGTTYPDLAAWQGTGFDANSIETDPGFFSKTDLHTIEKSINGIGMPLSEVTEDLEGTSRNAVNPDPGAYEFDPPPFEAAIVAITSPVSACGLGNEPISIQILNRGTSAISGGLTAYYSLNGGTPVSANISGTYAVDDTFSFTFPTPVDFTAPIGDTLFTIDAWIDLSGDPLSENDSLTAEVYSRYQAPAPTTTDDVVNFGQQATLTASSSYPVFWFKDPSGGNAIRQADTLTTPVLWDTTAYYASVQGPGPSLKITEIVTAYNYTGYTSPYPTFIPPNDFDGIEITNLGSAPAHLGGYIMQLVGDVTLSWQFPSGIFLDPGEVLVLIHYNYPATVTDDPANNLYVMSTNHWAGAYNDIGYILRSPDNSIIDVTATYGYIFNYQTTGVSSSDWSGSLSGGYAGISRAVSDNNTASDWFVPTNTNRQTFGSPNPGLSQETGAGCFSDRAVANAYVINIPPLGEPELNPDTLSGTINSCDDSLSFTVNISNTGDSILDYSTANAQVDSYDSTSYMTYSSTGASTTHTFHHIDPNADSIQLVISFRGDYDQSYEYVDLYIEGQSIGTIQDGDVGTYTIVTVNFSFSGTDVSNWLSDGQLTVVLDNNSSVNWGYTDEFHQVQLLVNGKAHWIEVPDVSGSIAPGNSTSINVKFKSTGLLNGSYASAFPIDFNNPATPQLFVTCLMEVNGSPEMQLPGSCLAFGDQMQYTYATDSFMIKNTGCDTLIIDSILPGNTAYTCSPGQSVLYPGQSDTFAVTYYPQGTGNFDTDLSIYSNIPMETVCLTGSSFAPPQIAVVPDSLGATLTGCQDSTMLSFDIQNNGDTTLLYNLIGGEASAAQPLCTPATTGHCCDMGIYRVKIGTIDTTTNDGVEGYQDYTSSQMTFLNVGESYPIYVQTGPDYDEHVRVWIDFNNNGDFELSEIVMESMNTRIDHYDTLQVPANAYANTPLRMRVMSEYYSSGLPFPCNNLQYGQCEDYAVIILNGIYHAGDSGSIAPGSSETINIWLKAEGLNSGIYDSHVSVASNDPLNPVVNVKTQLEIIGAPDIAVNPDSLQFDSLMIGAVQTLQAEVRNTGCSTLVVNSISSGSGSFTFSPDTFIVAPGESEALTITFSPLSTGMLSTQINLQGNAQATNIFVAGTGLPAPDIQVIPDSLLVTITGCNDSVTEYITLNNLGTADLLWDANSTTGMTSLDSVLNRFNAMYSSITSTIPNIYYFSDGVTSYYISDGGNDMYDGANYLSTNIQSNIYYSDNSIISSTAFGPNGKYFTRKVDGLWLLAADVDSIDFFEITGNLGADGNGNADGTILEKTFNGIQYQGYVKRVYNAYSDPSINHLIIMEKNPDATHYFTTNTNYDDHRISNLHKTSRIYYLLYAGRQGSSSYYIDDSATAQIMDAFLDVINPSPPWLKINPESDTLAPSGTQQIAATFYSESLPNGTYRADIEISSNDPDEPKIQVPSYLTVAGTAQIAYSPSQLNYGNTMQGTSSTLSIWIYNDGCGYLTADSVWTTSPADYQASYAQFSIPPNDSLELMVDFAPSTNGTISATLKLQTNLGLYNIPLNGIGVPQPVIAVNPAAFDITINSCDDSVTEDLWVYNTGMGDLMYELLGGQTLNITREDSIHFTTNAAQTTHNFSNLPANADSLYITITINGDFDGSSEYASLYIEGQYIGVLDDLNQSNGTDIVLSYGFPNSQISSWISDGNLEVVVQNTSSVDPFSGLGNFHKVNVSLAAASWLTTSLVHDTIVSGDSTHISLKFKSKDLLSQTYYSTILINSNDPFTPQVTIPCTLTVAGSPVFVASDTCMHYGTVLVGNNKTDTLNIRNKGCDTLFLNNVTVTDADFTVVAHPPYIFPNDSADVIVRLNPASVGYYDDTLVLQTNAGTHLICLSGTGAAPPVLEYSPTSFTADIYNCEDTLALPLNISNAGVEDLIFNLSGDASDSVEVLAFTYGINTTVYNNMIYALSQHFSKYNLTEVYTTNANTLENMLNGKDIIIFPRFSVTNQSAFASFSSVLSDFASQGGTVLFAGIYDVSYSQNMYATGLLNGSYVTYVSSGNTTIDNADPLTTGLPSSIMNVSYVFMHNFTDPDIVRLGTYNTYDVLSYRDIGAGRVVYIGYDFYNYTYDAATILGRIVESSTRGGLPNWLRPAPRMDTVQSGDTTVVNVVFDAAGLVTGTYTNNLVINTNVPGSDGDSILCTLNLFGSPIADLPDSCVDIGAVKIGGSLSGSFSFFNVGCDELSISAISNDDPEITPNLSLYNLAVGDEATVDLLFQPLTTGLHVDTIRLTTNIGELKICVQAMAESAPELGIDPSSITASIIGCADSTTQQIRITNNGNAALNWTIPAQNSADNALYFDGYNDYVNLGSWNAGASWTLEAWVKPASLMTGRNTILGGVHNCQDWAITVQDGEFAMMIKPANALCSYTVKSGIAANQGYWYHVAAVNNGLQAKLYINGQLAVTQNVSAYYIGTNSGVRVGGEYCCWGNDFHGNIDEVRVWNAASTGTQIKNRMYTKLTGSESGLIGYWPFDEGTGGTTADLSGNGRNGSIYGPSWTSSDKPDDWLVVSPSSGSVPALDSTDIAVTFYSSDLSSGTFYQDLLIETDDPLNPSVVVPCTLNVTGEAEMLLSTQEIIFDTVMQYAMTTESFDIINNGCDSLIITSIVSDNANFAPAVTATALAAGFTTTIDVSFNPNTTGDHNGMLVIMSNVGNDTIMLSGYAKDRPVASISNDTLLGQPACTFTDTATVTIQNQGSVMLTLSYNLTPAVSWGQLVNYPPVISPGSQADIVFAFDKTGLTQGTYSSLLSIQTNDPLNPEFLVDVIMEIPNLLAPVDLGSDTGSCTGLSLTLDAGSGFASYLWNTGGTNSTLTVNTNGTYAVTATDNYGCVSMDSVYVGFYGYPTSLAGNDTSICENYDGIIPGNAANLLPPQSLDVKIGNGTSSTNSTVAVPFKTYYMDARTQLMYTREELNAAGFESGPIEEIGFMVTNAGSPAMSNLSIHIGVTGSSTMNGFVSGLQPCFDTSSYPAQLGWNMFDLQTPYYWNGTDNLVVEVCFDNNSYSYNSSMEYTYKPGMQWSNYCDNCAPGCNLGYGGYSNYRVNLRIIGKNDKTQYSWTGPNGYTTDRKDAHLINVNPSMAGTYTLTVDNGWGCTDSDQMVLSVLPSPEADAGPADTIMEGDTTQLAGSVLSGVAPYTYQWTPASFIDHADSLRPMGWPDVNTSYTLQVTSSNGCIDEDEVLITVRPVHYITGRLRYDNTQQSGIPNVRMYAHNASQVKVDSAITASDGSYSLRVFDGLHYLSAELDDKAWGGANATDALVIARHAVFYIQLQGLKLDAADVNLSSIANATDALQVMRRYVGQVDTFPAGDWIHDPQVTFGVYDDVTEHIDAINTGDVDASNVPGKSAPDYVRLAYAESEIYASGKEVSIPVYLNDPAELGAISLEIILPPEVEHIANVMSSLDGLIYHQTGRRLRIAWNDPVSRYFAQDERLFTLQCVLNTTILDPAFITLGQDNEIAGPDAEVLKTIELYTHGFHSGKDGPMLGQNFPDPFDRITYIPYYLPEASEISISLHDVLGRQIETLYEGRADKGNHLLTFDGSHLKPGAYFYRLRIGGDQPYEATYKMIISR